MLHKRAFEAGPKGERIEIDVPDDKKPVLDELYDALKESVAETSEELMDKYFSGEDFTYAEMIQGLRQGVKDLSLFPVVCGSAVSGLGTRMLLDIIVELLPSPLEGRPLMGENADGEVDEFVPFPGALPAALVWKTVSDQYGKYSFVKVISGNLKPDMQLVNSRTGATEKLGRLYVMKGKKAEEVKELECGDIGAIGKMEKVKTGDTLSDPRKVVKLEPIPFPEPCYSVAITPKTKGQEDKIAAGLIRLNEEDLTFNWVNNAETRQMVVSGTGDMQMDVILSRLKSRFGVDAELSEPRVPYREKIRKKVEVQGRHKKQTGGHGQFGDVWMRFEPGDTEELQFCEEVVGGAVPKNYFPAVEKGMREAVVHGVLAGYPVVYLKATLRNGFQDRRADRLQDRYAPGQPCAAGTHRRAEGHHPRQLHGRRHRRSEQAPGPRHGHEPRRRGQPDRGGRSAHGRDGPLCHRPALHDPGPRFLHLPLRPLRGRPSRRPGEGHRGRQGNAGGSRLTETSTRPGHRPGRVSDRRRVGRPGEGHQISPGPQASPVQRVGWGAEEQGIV